MAAGAQRRLHSHSTEHPCVPFGSAPFLNLSFFARPPQRPRKGAEVTFRKNLNFLAPRALLR